MLSLSLRRPVVLLAGVMAAADLPKTVDMGSVSYMIMSQLKASLKALFHHQLVTSSGIDTRPDDTRY